MALAISSMDARALKALHDSWYSSKVDGNYDVGYAYPSKVNPKTRSDMLRILREDATPELLELSMKEMVRGNIHGSYIIWDAEVALAITMNPHFKDLPASALIAVLNMATKQANGVAGSLDARSGAFFKALLEVSTVHEISQSRLRSFLERAVEKKYTFIAMPLLLKCYASLEEALMDATNRISEIFAVVIAHPQAAQISARCLREILEQSASRLEYVSGYETDVNMFSWQRIDQNLNLLEVIFSIVSHRCFREIDTDSIFYALGRIFVFPQRYDGEIKPSNEHIHRRIALQGQIVNISFNELSCRQLSMKQLLGFWSLLNHTNMETRGVERDLSQRRLDLEDMREAMDAKAFYTSEAFYRALSQNPQFHDCLRQLLAADIEKALENALLYNRKDLVELLQTLPAFQTIPLEKLMQAAKTVAAKAKDQTFEELVAIPALKGVFTAEMGAILVIAASRDSLSKQLVDNGRFLEGVLTLPVNDCIKILKAVIQHDNRQWVKVLIASPRFQEASRPVLVEVEKDILARWAGSALPKEYKEAISIIKASPQYPSCCILQ